VLQHYRWVRCAIVIVRIWIKLVTESRNNPDHIFLAGISLHKLRHKHDSRCLGDHEGDSGEVERPAVFVFESLPFFSFRSVTHLVVNGRNVEDYANRQRESWRSDRKERVYISYKGNTNMATERKRNGI